MGGLQPCFITNWISYIEEKNSVWCSKITETWYAHVPIGPIVVLISFYDLFPFTLTSWMCVNLVNSGDTVELCCPGSMARVFGWILFCSMFHHHLYGASSGVVSLAVRWTVIACRSRLTKLRLMSNRDILAKVILSYLRRNIPRTRDYRVKLMGCYPIKDI